MSPKHLGRRGLLAGAGATTLAAAGLGSLTACSSDGATTAKGGAKKSAALKLPTYVAAKTAKPDLSAEGVDPVYLRYPADTVKSVARKPGDGKPIKALTAMWSTLPPGQAKNGYWKELSKRLGSSFDMEIINGNIGDGYQGKLNALVAANELGDLVWFPPGGDGIPKVDRLLESKFHDLTDHLSGDAVKEFPNLANLPTLAWKGAVMNGKLYGPAISYGRLGQVYMVNEDFWKPVGGIAFDSAQDFLDKGRELLDTKRKKYVLEPAYLNHLHMFAEWFGVASGWTDSGGKLRHQYEHPAYIEALAYAAKVFKAKLFWPDANTTTAIEKVGQGNLGAYVQSYPGYRVDLRTQSFTSDVIVPFAATADSKPVFDMGAGNLGFSAVTKTVPKARIKTLLNVLDYLAAPFGSDERKFLDNGVEGRHYSMAKGGELKPTAMGEAEAVTTAQAVATLCQGPEVLYVPGEEKALRRAFETQKKLIAMQHTNAVLGHYSDTATAKGKSLSTTMSDLATDIITGRKPASAWKPAVRAWRRDGGDAMRGEYQKSLAAQ